MSPRKPLLLTLALCGACSFSAHAPPSPALSPSSTLANAPAREEAPSKEESNDELRGTLLASADGKIPIAAAAQAVAASAAAPVIMVYSATLTMAVFEVDEQLGQVEAAARDLGGFLAQRSDVSITIRVPAARFDQALARIARLGDVVHRQVSAEDMTEQYRDLEVRMKNAQSVRDRLADLLTKAQRVQDALEIQRELARVTEELERIEGRLRYLRDRAQLSTITVNFQRRAVEQVGPQVRLPFPWLSTLGLSRLLNLRGAGGER